MAKKFTVTLTITVAHLEDGDAYIEESCEPITEREARHQLRGYVHSAVRQWGGQYHPNDFLFSGNIKNVAVKSVK